MREKRQKSDSVGIIEKLWKRKKKKEKEKVKKSEKNKKITKTTEIDDEKEMKKILIEIWKEIRDLRMQ